MTINVFDAAGNLVDSEEVGAQQAGTYAFNWDGIDYDGQEQPDGTYSVTFAAEDINGQPVLTSTEVAGVVTSVESVDGNTLLNLSDGRSVNILDVREVAMVSQGTSQDAQDESGS
jgi:flagellar basal-body rod modification protein FlgD